MLKSIGKNSTTFAKCLQSIFATFLFENLTTLKNGLLIISLARVLYSQDNQDVDHESCWRRRIIVLEKNPTSGVISLHVLRTDFRCAAAVSREIRLHILDTKWNRPSCHSLQLTFSVFKTLDIKFDSREEAVRWINHLGTAILHQRQISPFSQRNG